MTLFDEPHYMMLGIDLQTSCPPPHDFALVKKITARSAGTGQSDGVATVSHH
jgi:hypothetical protein